MITANRPVEELFASVDDTTSEFLQTVASFGEREINQVPFQGSWTAAQVAEHVARSNIGITKELRKPGKPCERQPDAGVQDLQKTFLNFDTKLKSPEFILPTRDSYLKEALVAHLKRSIEDLKEVSENQDLFQIILHPIFGKVTKLEMLHFVVYHTQRHIHQLKNIRNAIEDQKKKSG